MLTKNSTPQEELIFQTLEELVPSDHIVRKINLIDYSFIYDQVGPLYSCDGRPGIDPVILFKILTLKAIFNVSSIRKTMKELEVNLAFRWFIKIPLSQKLPSHSVISTNIKKRFKKPFLVEKILKEIFQQVFDLNIISSKDVNLSQQNLKIYQTNDEQTKVMIDDHYLYETTLV